MGDIDLQTAVTPLGDPDPDGVARFSATVHRDWEIWGPEGGYVAAIVPGKPIIGDSTSIPVAKSDWKLLDGSTREGVLIEPVPHKNDKAAKELPRKSAPENTSEPEEPHLRIADTKMYGVLFAFVAPVHVLPFHVSKSSAPPPPATAKTSPTARR